MSNITVGPQPEILTESEEEEEDQTTCKEEDVTEEDKRIAREDEKIAAAFKVYNAKQKAIKLAKEKLAKPDEEARKQTALFSAIAEERESKRTKSE